MNSCRYSCLMSSAEVSNITSLSYSHTQRSISHGVYTYRILNYMYTRYMYCLGACNSGTGDASADVSKCVLGRTHSQFFYWKMQKNVKICSHDRFVWRWWGFRVLDWKLEEKKKARRKPNEEGKTKIERKSLGGVRLLSLYLRKMPLPKSLGSAKRKYSDEIGLQKAQCDICGHLGRGGGSRFPGRIKVANPKKIPF